MSFRDDLAKNFHEVASETTLEILNLFASFLKDRQEHLESINADFDRKRLIDARLDELANFQLLIHAAKKGLGP
jgi:hypothetical protein